MRMSGWHKDPSGAPKSPESCRVSRYLVGGAVGTAQHPVPLTLIPDPVAFVLVTVPGDTDTGCSQTAEGQVAALTQSRSSGRGSARATGPEAKMGPSRWHELVPCQGLLWTGRRPRCSAGSDGDRPRPYPPGLQVCKA